MAQTATETKTAYDELIERIRDVKLLGSTAGLLSWDQETMLPPGGVEHRSRQLAQLARITHGMATDPRVGELLGTCEEDPELTADPYSDAAANLREIRRTYDRATKLPSELVSEMAETRSVAKHEWAAARKNSDFSRFRPWLEKNLRLAREAADHYGWEGERWDALAEGFEPGMTAAGIAEIFTPLRDRLTTLVDELLGGPKRPSTVLREARLPIERQRAFVTDVIRRMGFDFERGRLDLAAHPFCSGSHPGDVRLTTRFKEDNVGDALAATMHEAGHGLYEQGLPAEHAGTPLGQVASLGLHESQSRMWENQVGRSAAFWRWCHPELLEHFGDPVSGLSVDDAYGGANVVERSLIRVEADEATYNLHIMVRFELERSMVGGDLDVGDVPDAWNERYRDYLGIDVPDDARGCLQDIHWAMGGFGYFPTYTLGNLYCAQLFEKARENVGDLDDRFARGDFAALKEWLNDNVHRHGARYPADVLCERVTGEPLGPDPLLRHLEGKLRPLYGV